MSQWERNLFVSAATFIVVDNLLRAIRFIVGVVSYARHV